MNRFGFSSIKIDLIIMSRYRRNSKNNSRRKGYARNRHLKNKPHNWKRFFWCNRENKKMNKNKKSYMIYKPKKLEKYFLTFLKL